MEGDRHVAVAEGGREVRRSSVHREIARLHSGGIHGIAQVNNKVHWLGVDDAVAGGSGAGHGKTHQLSVGKSVLLRGAVDDHAPVRPCSQVLGQYRRAVVVVAYVSSDNARIGLQRQRAGYVRERIVRQPGNTVVVGLTRMHLVARGARAGRLATGCYPRRFVVPGGKECACVTDREIRLPLRLGWIGVGVQLEWRTEGHPIVGGPNVIDVTGVAAVFLRIDKANYPVVGRRLTPAHVPPVSRAGIHRAEETRI